MARARILDADWIRVDLGGGKDASIMTAGILTCLLDAKAASIMLRLLSGDGWVVKDVRLRIVMAVSGVTSRISRVWLLFFGACDTGYIIGVGRSS
jgi:hypothetical protein